MSELIFSVKSKGGKGLYLVQYLFPHKALGFFFSIEEDGSFFLKGIPVPLNIIVQLYGLRGILRFKKILKEICHCDSELLFYVDQSFFDFLCIYLEQRRIEMGYVLREVIKYDIRYRRIKGVY